MVTKTKSKRQQSIKSKLIAAVCMLLVSTIMMVSSTYAWFTLSTAPEVTGITTSVGANGNLEMALLPESGNTSDITSSAGDSGKPAKERNVTWGNLVDLSDAMIYGLDKIVLYPAALNAATQGDNGNAATLKEALLQTPAYGADGRVSNLLENTVTSTYDSTGENFPNNTKYGVRAVGVASGMTDRQLDYRNARSAANTAAAQAQTVASQSLNNNGSALANIAIKHAMGGDQESYTAADVASLKNIVNDLKGTSEKTGALQYIETAYIQYILAYAASAATGDADTVWQAVKGAISAEGATLSSIMTAAGANMPETVSTAVAKYNSMVTAVATADTALSSLSGDSFTWEQISAAMQPLAVTNKMLINGFAVSAVKDNLGDVVSSVTSQGGLKVTMKSGAGVYADIADQCGDYSASITIDRVEYNGIVLTNMTATMETNSDLNPNYLSAISTAVASVGAPKSAEGKELPITDMYGYVIDLAFRTNAAESNLLLQTSAANRIYETGGTSETLGGGAYMAFKATTSSFSNQQVVNLMNAIRIVFYDPGSKAVLANAKLDITKQTIDAVKGIVAPIKIYTGKPSGTVTTVEYSKLSGNVTYNADNEYFTLKAEETYKYDLADVDAYLAGTQLYKKAAEADTYTAIEMFDASKTYYTYTPGTGDAEGTYAAVANNDVLKTAITNKTPLYRAKADGSGYDPVTVTFDASNAYTKTKVEAEYDAWEPEKTTEEEIATEFAAKVGSEGGLYIKTTTTTDAVVNYLEDDAAVITALTQNTAQRVSVLVYLDGEKISNTDVAATVATSVKGTMNLQFASSAALVPMEYTQFMNQTGSSGTATTTYTKVAADAAYDSNTEYYTESISYTVLSELEEVKTAAAEGTLYSKTSGADDSTYAKVTTAPTELATGTTYAKQVKNYAKATVTADNFESMKTTLYVKK